MTRVVCIGEAMIEVSPDQDDDRRASLSVAGDVYNVAVYLKRSAPDLDISFASRIGRDAFSNRIADALAAEGIGTGHLARGDGTPGLYAITTDARGERSFTYWRSASAARAMVSALDLGAIAGADLVYLSGITLAILPPEDRTLLLDTLSDTRVAFDSNYRPTLWEDAASARNIIERATRHADIVLSSADDEAALFGDADEAATRARLNDWGVTDGALKRGELGPVSLGDPVSATYSPAARVIDTTAAGDSFNAAYLAARLSGRPQSAALQAGHALATRVVGHRGAIISKDATC